MDRHDLPDHPQGWLAGEAVDLPAAVALRPPDPGPDAPGPAEDMPA